MAAAKSASQNIKFEKPKTPENLNIFLKIPRRLANRQQMGCAPSDRTTARSVAAAEC